MPINFIPNDPLAAAPPMRRKAPRPDRKPTQAGFSYNGAVAEALYEPGTPEFLFWQCREGALAALELWDSLDGSLSNWARALPTRRKLRLLQNDGTDLNAYYDGQSLSFFEHTRGNKATFSGASTDVVAHEAGHALLDAIRPDLWDTPYTEVGAFHEAFGDCLAILTAFADRETGLALLATSANLGAKNFVEATAEDLSDGVRRALGSQHPASQPRHALNSFQWQLPSTLPSSGPPARLTGEVHSFARVFTGCFYDTIRNLFATQPAQDEQTLLAAAQTAGKLLVAAARAAPETSRFFRAVGRTMILVDQQQNSATNRLAIRDAFQQHNIALGSSSMLAPTATLEGAAPRIAAKAASLATATSKDLLERIRAAKGAKLTVDSLDLAGERIIKAVHRRAVELGDVDRRLKGVIALAAEPVLVGAAGARAAILGALPEEHATADEVLTFVETLVKHGQLLLETPKRGAAVATTEGEGLPTHTVRARGKKKVLTRIRFVCGPVC